MLSKLSHTELHHLPHTKRSRSSPSDHAFDFVDLWTDLRTHESIFDLEPLTHWSTNPRTRAFDFIGDPEPSHHEPTNRSLSLFVILIFCVILIDPWTDLGFCVILIFYFLSLISDFFVVVVVVWVVVFWWFSCCVVVGFVWVVVENSIFRMLPNTWKYFLEQFS